MRCFHLGGPPGPRRYLGLVREAAQKRKREAAVAEAELDLDEERPRVRRREAPGRALPAEDGEDD